MGLQEHTFQSIFENRTDQAGGQFKIEIPIIQRDYAQGRELANVQRIRNRFLDAIYKAITGHKKMILDFVYGEIENQKFIPLDGQQRLTTLFLLHWYAAKKEGVKDSKFAFLKQFTYYTRPSSRDFCDKLVDFTPSFDAQLSNEIEDQPWFQYQWKNDPTILGMLVMIDAIHEKFRDTNDLWDALVDHPCLSFYFLSISEMGMTDELYVKMNSRGKPLSQFEHFKAEFETLIKAYDEELSNEISRKFDLDWTDMLFPYRGANQIIDDEFMRYFFFVSDILFYQQYPEKPLEQDEFVLAEKLYGHDCLMQKENIDFMVSAFDCWCRLEEGTIDALFEKHLSAHKYQKGKTKIYQDNLNIFKQCCENYREYEGRNRKFPLNMTLLLYAFIVYLQNRQNISESDFQRRIRIVRNLIWNSQFEIRADGQRNNMPQLLVETKEIILNGRVSDGSGYNKNQKEEERCKQVWLNEHPDDAETIFHLEDHSLLYGCIKVVGLENLNNFDKFRMLFDNVADKTLIHRALLIFDDYSQTASGNVHYMGNQNDSTWRDLFHPSNKRGQFERTSNALNSLLQNITDFSDEGLLSLINGFIETCSTYDWRYYFIKYSETLCGNRGVMCCVNAPYDWYSLHQSTFRGYNWQSIARAIHQKDPKKFRLGNWAYRQYEPLYYQATPANKFKIIVSNAGYEIYGGDGTWMGRIDIHKDDDGIDTVDRVEYLLANISLVDSMCVAEGVKNQ